MPIGLESVDNDNTRRLLKEDYSVKINGQIKIKCTNSNYRFAIYEKESELNADVYYFQEL